MTSAAPPGGGRGHGCAHGCAAAVEARARRREEEAATVPRVFRSSALLQQRRWLGSCRLLVLSALACGLLRDLTGGAGPLRAAAQIAEPIEWTDVCTSEDLANYKDALCKPTFFVSTLAFNPLGPQVTSHMTVILQPSKKIPQDDWLARVQYIDLDLPGFEPIGTMNVGMATKRDLTLTPMNDLIVGVDPEESYNTIVNPLFMPTAVYNTLNGILRLQLVKGLQMLPDIDTEVVICCMRLPNESPKNDKRYRISAPTNEGATAISILDEYIKSVPYIDPGFQFAFLQVMFDPPVSMQLTTIALTVRASNNLKDRQQIILHMPQVSRVLGEDGWVDFSTADSLNPLDWMLFSSKAKWDNTAHSLHFFLREGQVFTAGRQITLKTMPGDFRLPIMVEPNSNLLEVEARSLDMIDEIIAKTPVSQSSNVPHVRMFPVSQLRYHDDTPSVQTDVTFTFMTNRPMFVGSQMYMRLSGFRSEVVDVVLIGATKFHFQHQKARYHMPENLMELNVTMTMYSDEAMTSIQFHQLFLPPALYANDSSLLVWTSDPDAFREPIQMSPEVCGAVCGGEQKTFIRSQIAYEPAEPRLPANVTFTILPSIYFYQGDEVVLHLYGFVCTSFYVPLSGPGASKIEMGAGRWYGSEYMLVLRVGQNQIIDNYNPLVITINRDQNFRLPGLLSKNDGTLRIEGRGAIIIERPLLKVPAMGDAKAVIDSRVDIEPYWPSHPVEPYARIVISFILNSDVLPNSTLSVKLGGILRNPPDVSKTPIGFDEGRSGEVLLSGKNAPLFFNVGQWNHDNCVLTLKTKPEYIYAGEYIRFFLERDMYFQLPPAAYRNDPAFRIAIPGAGIAEEQFKYSTKWVDRNKEFKTTILYYGDPGSVWYPGEAPDVNFKFEPNVDLYAGTVITLKLPGFTHSSTTVILSPPETAVSNEYDISGFIPFAAWDPFTEELKLTVPVGNAIIQRLNVMRVRAVGNAGFMLPITSLSANDPRLRISVDGNQYIYEEQIQSSPRIVRRTFLISTFEYRPPVKESIFLFIMRLQPAVNISYPADIVINLPGFRNSLSKQKIEISGPSRSYIKLAEGQWNETTEMLTFPMIFNGEVIQQDEMLEFRIKESQGFILPSKLQRNDPTIRITSLNNILWEPVKTSPMVGNMPYAPHRFCMHQYEDAVRTREPICHTAKDCDPPLTDPCNAAELERCGCDARLDEQFNFTIQGFNLEATDTLHFLPYAQLCDVNTDPEYLGAFTLQTAPPVITREQDEAMFYGFQAMQSGYFRMCYMHAGTLFDIGFVKVKPSCESPYVMVGGTCVEHCPKTKIPVAGACIRDPTAMSNSDNQALMMEVRMKDPVVTDGPHLSQRNSDDQEFRYYTYRFTYELARILNCDPKRIVVASISEGSTLVNTVFTTAGDEDATMTTTQRSPAALISLLTALRMDTSSSMYQNVFFQNIEKPRLIMDIVHRDDLDPGPLNVRLCEDGVYRTFCPYTGEIIANGVGYTTFLVAVLVIPVALGLLCFCLWKIDFETPPLADEDVLDRLRTQPSTIEKPLQVEYARSWLEGRFMGEQWQSARSTKLLALSN